MDPGSSGNDRIPLYLDKKTNNTTNAYIEEILSRSPECRELYEAMAADMNLIREPLKNKTGHIGAAGKIVMDMTPAAVGPYVVPCCNFDELQDVDNFNMVTCGGQATIPIAYAINQAADSEYTEIVACLSSKSAGPGTRANIDEFTQTTRKALEVVGGADRAKAIIILNPAEPPVMMTNTIYSIVKNPDEEKIVKSVMDMVKNVQAYVPGYQLRVPPVVDGNKVTVIVQVEGAGDFLPKYSGNLDIINQAAVAVAERIASKMLKEGK